MRKELYKKYFENKKITVMGLGLLGRGIAVTKFLAECRAILTVTDLKSKDDLKTSLAKLKKYKINYILGKHDLKYFKNKDMIIKSAGVPLNSPYIEHARKNNVTVEMEASLLTKIVRETYPEVKIVGITGTRGKSMTTALIYYILSDNKAKLGCNVILGGNMRNVPTLPILETIGPKDILVLELDSWQCQGFGDNKISPDIAIFTSFMKDHMTYYKNDVKKYLLDKSYIYRFQKRNDIFITNKETLKKLSFKPRSQTLIPKKSVEDKINKLNLNIIGQHNISNASLAYQAVKEFGLIDQEIFNSLENFKGLEGRLQVIKTRKNIIINDNNATTPEAVSAGIEAVKSKYPKSKIILIAGGSDKGLELTSLLKNLKKISKLVLLSGLGTNKLIEKLKIKYTLFDNFKEAMTKTIKESKRGDVILFSPGFASFGMFKNEYDRNDQFIKIIKNIMNYKPR